MNLKGRIFEIGPSNLKFGRKRNKLVVRKYTERKINDNRRKTKIIAVLQTATS